MNDLTLLLVGAWLLSVVLCGWIGYAIGHGKNLSTEGAALGALLGILGVVIVAVMPKREVKPKWKPGQYAAKADPFAEFEAREQAKTILPPPPNYQKPPPDHGEG